MFTPAQARISTIGDRRVPRTGLEKDRPEEPPPSGEVPSSDDPYPAILPAIAGASFFRPTSKRTSPQTRGFRRQFFASTTDLEWNDWRWQLRNRIRTSDHLERMLELSDDERLALTSVGSQLPLGITPYSMSLLDPIDSMQPLRRTVVPTALELIQGPGEAADPLGEEKHSPVPGIVHRYPDRALFLVHDLCGTYCRYCTRSRVVGHGEILPDQQRLEIGLDYIRRHPAIRDVLLSGGDPLTVSDAKLEWILQRLRQIPHVEIIRIGTKVPAVLPQRITPQLVKMLKRYHPLFMSLHFTHPDECTPETTRACARLADAGIPLGSQVVLLKNVNDNLDVMKSLMQKLLTMRVRPYYLYQCDPIIGSSHFRTSVEKGLEIMQGLRGWTSGYAVPTYVIDAPGGGGKIPIQGDYCLGRSGDDIVLKNYEGQTYRYPDPIVAPIHAGPDRDGAAC